MAGFSVDQNNLSQLMYSKFSRPAPRAPPRPPPLADTGSASTPVLMTEVPEPPSAGTSPTQRRRLAKGGAEGQPRKKIVPLRTIGPTWWTMPPEVERAANRFDERLSALHSRAEKLQTALDEAPDLRLERCLSEASGELWRHRFVVPEHCLANLNIVRTEKRSPRRRSPPKRKWRLEESIWAPRKQRSDSKDFIDTDECELARFETDWQEALIHKLGAHIKRTDEKLTGAPSAADARRGSAFSSARSADRGGGGGGGFASSSSSSSKGGLAAAAAGDGGADEISEVREVLWEHHDMIYMVYFHYASLSGGNDIFSINLLAFHAFVEDCRLAVPGSVGCQRRHLDQLFVNVNASGVGIERDKDPKKPPGGAAQAVKADKHNKSHSLNRQEFLQVLVRIATARYVLTGRMADVSDAVRALLEDDVRARVAVEMLHDLNVFRVSYCYTEEVDDVLRRHEASLRVLYKVYAGGDDGKKGDDSAGLDRKSLLGYDEWMKLCRDVQIFDAECPQRQGTLCFLWARMCVVGSEDDDATRVKLIHLYFEDFLEALVRLATMKALPLDDEIEKAGFKDAGDFMINLQRYPSVYQKFLADHAQHWDEEPLQPIGRCVEHLITLIIRTVETGGATSSGGEDMKLSEREVGAFRRLCEGKEEAVAGTVPVKPPRGSRRSTFAAGAAGSGGGGEEE